MSDLLLSMRGSPLDAARSSRSCSSNAANCSERLSWTDLPAASAQDDGSCHLCSALSGQWPEVSGQRSAVSGQRSAVSGQRGQRGQWSMAGG